MPAANNLAICFKNLKQFRQMRYQREIVELMEKVKRTRTIIKNEGCKQNIAEWMTSFNQKYPAPSPSQQKQMQAEMIIRANCTTPGQGIWHIMMDLGSIGNKYMKYFQDTVSYKIYYLAAIAEGEQAVKKYRDDTFHNEISYSIIMDYSQLALVFGNKEYYQTIKTLAEKFLETWPSYRLVEYVEDAYENALKKLGK